MSVILAAFIGGAVAGALIAGFYEHRIYQLKRMVEANVAIMQSGHNLIVVELIDYIKQLQPNYQPPDYDLPPEDQQ